MASKKAASKTPSLLSSFADYPEINGDSFVASYAECGIRSWRTTKFKGGDGDEDVKIPNPSFGFLDKQSEIVTRKRWETTVSLIIRKSQGLIGLNVERTDWKQLEGKKPQQMESALSNLGMAKEATGFALDLTDVQGDSRKLTLTFCKPLRIYEQQSQERFTGQVTYKACPETDDFLIQASPDSSVQVTLHFDDENGDECYRSLQKYFEQLSKHRAAAVGASLKDERKQRTTDAFAAQRPQTIDEFWARKTVEAFGLQPSFFDRRVTENEWKAFYELRCKFSRVYNLNVSQSSGFESGVLCSAANVKKLTEAIFGDPKALSERKSSKALLAPLTPVKPVKRMNNGSTSKTEIPPKKKYRQVRD